MWILMSNKTYDKLKFLTQIIIPAIATFYFTISEIWRLPYATEIVGTITAIDTLLGACLHKVSADYNNQDNNQD